MIENRLFKFVWQLGGFLYLVAIQRLPAKRRPQLAPILVVIEGSGPRWRRHD